MAQKTKGSERGSDLKSPTGKAGESRLGTRTGKAKPKAEGTSRASSPRKPAAKPKSPSKVGTKAKPDVTKARKGEKVPVLLSGGNPQIAKGDGDAPVQAYIAGMPGWKREIGKRLDELIVRNVPNVRKAVKWNSPLYGIEGQGWFLGGHVYTHYVKLTFFNGSSLRPLPPGASKSKNVRYVDIREDGFDEAQMAAWIKQAAALPGWVP